MMILSHQQTTKMAISQSKYLRSLSVWIGFVAVMALGNTVQCFIDPSFLSSRLYTRNPSINVTSLAARLFGIWTLLSGILRFACAINIHNKILYDLTFFSFFLAFGHFVTELYPYETAELSIGVLAPLTVSSMSIILMSVGYFFLEHNAVPLKEGENSVLQKKPKIT